MSLTKQTAWLIFESEKLGQEQGKSALKNMPKDEHDAYLCFYEDFELEVAKVGALAQNEAASIMEANNIDIEILQAKKPYLWVAEDYRSLVGLFEGSQYEQLHLSAMFRYENFELLLQLAKPES